MTRLGILLFFSAVGLILYRYIAAKPSHPFPRYGYAGVVILVMGEALMLAKVEPVATYFTAIAWTGYILWADAAAFSLRGRSLLRSYRLEFAWIASCSVPLWLIFEAYNLRLNNWVYVGVPEGWFAQTIGFAWAFATIWPAIFETAALWSGFAPPALPPVPPKEAKQPSRMRVGHWGAGITSLGAVMLIAPILMPAAIRPYLFGSVWLGFIFLLEPINRRTGSESLWRDIEQGRFRRTISLLAAGMICGIFWEFWNFWATARWVYIFPIFQRAKIFAMPLPGYLGFPSFAVECFACFAFLVPAINFILKKLGASARFRTEALDM